MTSTFIGVETEYQRTWDEHLTAVLASLEIALTPEQWEVLSSENPKLQMAGGEGSGKSFVAGVDAIAHALWDLRSGIDPTTGRPVAELYWFIAVNYEDAYKEFRYFLDFAENLGLVDNPAENVSIRDGGRDKCFAVLNTGQRFETVTALFHKFHQ